MIENERSAWVKFPIGLFGFVCIGCSIALLVILFQSDDDCNYSLRNYLLVFSLTLLLLGLPLFLVETFFSQCLKSTTGVVLYFTLIAIVLACLYGLQGIGLFIIAEDENCGEAFTDGYQLTLAISGLFLVISGVLLAVFIFWALNVVLKQRKGYQNLDN